MRGGERASAKPLAVSRAKVRTPVVESWWREMRSSMCTMMAAHADDTGKEVG